MKQKEAELLLEESHLITRKLVAERDAEIEQLKALLARAAEALENASEWSFNDELIAELRKAAE